MTEPAFRRFFLAFAFACVGAFAGVVVRALNAQTETAGAARLPAWAGAGGLLGFLAYYLVLDALIFGGS